MQRLQPDALLLNDLCPEMKECLGDLLCQNGVQFVSGDAETLEFPKDTELITSCSTLQWFSNPRRFFARCHSFLSEGGYLAFSTFGTGNMREIHALTGNGLHSPANRGAMPSAQPVLRDAARGGGDRDPPLRHPSPSVATPETDRSERYGKESMDTRTPANLLQRICRTVQLRKRMCQPDLPSGLCGRTEKREEAIRKTKLKV